MSYLAARVQYDPHSAAQGADLISSIFDDLGIPGVVVDDPKPDADPDWAPNACPPPREHAVTGYLPAPKAAILSPRLEMLLAELQQSSGLKYRVSYQPVDEEDWAESWKPFFKVQHIGRHLVVKPSWQDYAPAPHDKLIELDPGMAFGTGTHPTTMLCLELLEDFLGPADGLLDIGTGSGILLIAGARLSRGRLWGVDQDYQAAHIARANLLRNGIAEPRFEIVCGLGVSGIKTPFQCVTANILTPVILELITQLPRVCAPQGFFICSGILTHQQAEVVQALEEATCLIRKIVVREDWVAIAAQYMDNRSDDRDLKK